MIAVEYFLKPPTALETKVFLGHVDEALFLIARSLVQLEPRDAMLCWLESLSEAQTMLIRMSDGRCVDDDVSERVAKVIVSMLEVAVSVGMERTNSHMSQVVLDLQYRAIGQAK